MPQGRSCTSVTGAPAALALASRASTSFRVATIWPRLNSPLRAGPGDAGIFGKLRARVEGENLPPGEVEHEDGASRVRVVAAVLGCYHTGRLEAERSVERECAIEVGNGQGYHIDARFHQSLCSLLPPS